MRLEECFWLSGQQAKWSVPLPRTALFLQGNEADLWKPVYCVCVCLNVPYRGNTSCCRDVLHSFVCSLLHVMFLSTVQRIIVVPQLWNSCQNETVPALLWNLSVNSCIFFFSPHEALLLVDFELLTFRGTAKISSLSGIAVIGTMRAWG